MPEIKSVRNQNGNGESERSLGTAEYCESSEPFHLTFSGRLLLLESCQECLASEVAESKGCLDLHKTKLALRLWREAGYPRQEAPNPDWRNHFQSFLQITGKTNSPPSENLDKISSELETMRLKIQHTEAIQSSAQSEESFRIDETNRVTIFYPINHGPIVFFKLRHMPISISIRGAIQANGGQTPMIGIGSQANVVWAGFASVTSLNQCTFFFDYTQDPDSTNLVKAVSTAAGEVFFDGMPLSVKDILH